MKTLKDLKKAIDKDKKLKKQFMSLKSKEDAVKLAYDMGYDITLEELENDEEVNEDLLESVAGGRDKIEIETKSVKIADISNGDEIELTNDADINKTTNIFKKMEERYKNGKYK